MKRIQPDHKIFCSEDFLKDQYKFHIFFVNFRYETVELYSDEENYVVCRGAEGLPVWIWTKEHFDESRLHLLEETMDLYLTGAEKAPFTCKKEIYDLLRKDGYPRLNPDDYFEMGFLFCRKTKMPKHCEGRMEVPEEADLEVLAQYWFDDSREMRASKPVSMEQARKDIQILMAGKRFYIWRDDSGKIVSMANYTQVGKQARLNHVYTPESERSKGYAANLICGLTGSLLQKGLVPLLYTDYRYLPSNRAYINAGYEDGGVLINFSCSRKSKTTE